MQIQDNTEQPKQEVKEEVKYTMESVEGFPEHIKLRNDSAYIVSTRNGQEYIFNDIPADKMLRAEKRSKDQITYQLFLVSEMTGIVEEELQKLPGSVFSRLRTAMIKILDLDSFL